MTTTPDATFTQDELRIAVPQTLTCETLVYLLRDETGRAWIGFDEPTLSPHSGVMGHFVPSRSSKEGSVSADGDHVSFVIPASASHEMDGAGIAYLAPAELLATLVPPAPSQEPEGAAADGATSEGRSSEEG